MSLNISLSVMNKQTHKETHPTRKQSLKRRVAPTKETQIAQTASINKARINYPTASTSHEGKQKFT
jgi:hypothetical protein